MLKSYPIAPVSAPRMTRSDKWKKRPCVMRYFAFRDEVRAHRVEISPPCKVTFYVEMPLSWSQKKRAAFNGRPHMNKPDVDNFLKAILDSVFEDDAHVWSVWSEKVWADTASITVEPIKNGAVVVEVGG